MRESATSPNSAHQIESVYLESCPKCHFVHPDAPQPDCMRCGLIYAKYRRRQSATGETFEDVSMLYNIWEQLTVVRAM